MICAATRSSCSLSLRGHDMSQTAHTLGTHSTHQYHTLFKNKTAMHQQQYSGRKTPRKHYLELAQQGSDRKTPQTRSVEAPQQENTDLKPIGKWSGTDHRSGGSGLSTRDEDSLDFKIRSFEIGIRIRIRIRYLNPNPNIFEFWQKYPDVENSKNFKYHSIKYNVEPSYLCYMHYV